MVSQHANIYICTSQIYTVNCVVGLPVGYTNCVSSKTITQIKLTNSSTHWYSIFHQNCHNLLLSICNCVSQCLKPEPQSNTELAYNTFWIYNVLCVYHCMDSRILPPVNKLTHKDWFCMWLLQVKVSMMFPDHQGAYPPFTE